MAGLDASLSSSRMSNPAAAVPQILSTDKLIGFDPVKSAGPLMVDVLARCRRAFCGLNPAQLASLAVRGFEVALGLASATSPVD